MTAAPSEKAALRKMLRAKRSALDDEHRESAAASISNHLAFLSDRACVASFSATQNEVDLRPLHLDLLAASVRLAFPRVEGPGAMVFVEVQTLDELVAGAFGIAEPPPAKGVLGVIDVVLVPGVAFDRFGGRLGFGGGYYDRALADLRVASEKVPLFIGVGYTFQVLETKLPSQEWDIKLDSVVTEDGFVLPVGTSGEEIDP